MSSESIWYIAGAVPFLIFSWRYLQYNMNPVTMFIGVLAYIWGAWVLQYHTTLPQELFAAQLLVWALWIGAALCFIELISVLAPRMFNKSPS
jgi:hypothetical protein